MKNKALKVYSVDGNNYFVNHTINRAGSIGIVQDLNENFKISDDSIDFIFSENLIHYIKDWSHFFLECKRALKNTGLMTLFFHNPYSDFIRHKEEIPDYFEKMLLKETWNNGFKNPINVKFYYRPLEEIFKNTLNLGFRLVDFEEFKIDEIKYPSLSNLKNKIPPFVYLSFILEK